LNEEEEKKFKNEFHKNFNKILSEALPFDDEYYEKLIKLI